MHAKVQLIPSTPSRVMTGTKFGFIHTYIHTYIHFFKPIILTQKTQKHRNSSKSFVRNFHREKAKRDIEKVNFTFSEGIIKKYTNRRIK